MKKALILLFILFLIGCKEIPETTENMNIFLEWDGTNINISDIRLTKYSDIRNISTKGNYTLMILDYYDEVLYETKFNIMIAGWCTYGGECHREEMDSFIITTPYPHWSRKVVILKDGEIIAKQDISFRRIILKIFGYYLVEKK